MNIWLQHFANVYSETLAFWCFHLTPRPFPLPGTRPRGCTWLHPFWGLPNRLILYHDHTVCHVELRIKSSNPWFIAGASLTLVSLLAKVDGRCRKLVSGSATWAIRRERSEYSKFLGKKCAVGDRWSMGNWQLVHGSYHDVCLDWV